MTTTPILQDFDPGPSQPGRRPSRRQYQSCDQCWCGRRACDASILEGQYGACLTNLSRFKFARISYDNIFRNV